MFHIWWNIIIFSFSIFCYLQWWYLLTISSNTTFLFTCNFRMEGLKHLYPFYSKEYPMKIHFSVFGFNFYLFSSRTCMYAMQPTLWGVKHLVFCLWICFWVSCHELSLWVFDSWYRLQLLPLQPKSNLANFSHSTWHVLFMQCACSSFQQLHSVVGNNYMSISFKFHVPSSIQWIHLKNTFPFH